MIALRRRALRGSWCVVGRWIDAVLQQRPLTEARGFSDGGGGRKTGPSIPQPTHHPDVRALQLNKHVLEISEGVVEDLREGGEQKERHWLEGPGYRVVHPREKQLPLFERGLDRLHTILKTKRHCMDHVNVSTFLHQLGALGIESAMSSIILHHPIFKELLEITMEKLNDFEAMHVSNIVWAFATLGQASLHVSFGTSNGYQAMESLLMHAVRIISSFNPQCISLFANSLARLDIVGAREFMPLLAAVAKQQVAAFTPQDTSLLLHALAQLNYEDFVNLLPPLLRQLEARVDEFSDARQVANITWALEKLLIPPEGLVTLLEKMERWSFEHMDTFKTYEMATFVGSMVRLRFLPSPAFREKLDAYCVEHQSAFATNEISTLLVACANMGHKPQGLLQAIPSMKDYEQTEDVPSTTILIIWSLAMLEQLTPEWVQWAAHYLNKYPLLAFAEARLIQLAQAIVTLRLSHPDVDINDLLSSEIVQASMEHWRVTQTLKKIPSLLKAYSFAIRRLGYICECKILDTICVGATLATNPAGHRISIEIILPRKRFVNAPDKILCYRLWRIRMLEAVGWTVLHLAQDEFPWHIAQQVPYLKRQIDQLFPPSPPSQTEDLNVDVSG